MLRLLFSYWSAALCQPLAVLVVLHCFPPHWASLPPVTVSFLCWGCSIPQVGPTCSWSPHMGSMASALHRGWNLSFCPNFGPPFWPHTTLVSFVPFLFLHELFPPSFHIRTHLCMLCPSLPAPFYALSPIFCLLLLKVAYCLLPFHLESCSLLLSPSFLSFYLVYSLFLRSLYAYLGVRHISNCCCLFMFSVLSFLLTSQNSFLIACTHQHPLFYHILCAFARLILMSISSTTFLFTYDPLYRMH